MKERISFWSAQWLPVVMQSMPRANISSAMARVMPKPPAAFSPLTIDEIGLEGLSQPRQFCCDNIAPGAPDDVADEKNMHGGFIVLKPSNHQPGAVKMVRRLIITIAVWLAFMAALLFGAAGTLDWRPAWTFLMEMLVGGLAVFLWLLRHNPDLLRERLASPFQKQQVFSDKIFMPLVTIAWCGWIVLMGLDAERWKTSWMPDTWHIVGALLVVLCFVMTWFTFRENSFAAPVIKIQKERGQKVISSGPYRYVRHPMYVGAVLYFIGVPLAARFLARPTLCAAADLGAGDPNRARGACLAQRSSGL